MNAKEYLGQAYRLDQHINDRLMQLSQLRALTQRITTAYDGEMVSRTRNVHALEDSVIRLMEAEESINEEIDRFVDIKMDISKTIARVRNENYRLILEKRYLCFMTWEQISLDMHYTNRWLRKMHERALDVDRPDSAGKEQGVRELPGSTAGRRHDLAVGKRQHRVLPAMPHLRKADILTQLHAKPQIHLRDVQGGGFDSKSRKRTA